MGAPFVFRIALRELLVLAALFAGCSFLGAAPLWMTLFQPASYAEPGEEIRHPLEAPLPGGKTYQIGRFLVPLDAVRIALADALKYDPVKDTPFFRYLFIPSYQNELHVRVNQFVLNLVVSQSSFIHYAVWVHPNIIRVDLRVFAPRVDDLQNLIDTWEQLAFDPYFHEFLVLADELDIARTNTIDALNVFFIKTDEALQKVRDELKAIRSADVEREWAEFLRLGGLQQELSKRRQFNLAVLKRFVADADRAHRERRGGTDGDYTGFFSALKLLRDAVDELVRQADKIDDAATKQTRRSGTGALAANVEVPVPARHANIGGVLDKLVELTQSDAAITYSPYFVHRATSSVDLGHGAGLYYQLAGVQAGVDGNTDFEQALLDAGIDLEVVDQLRSKNRAAMFYSFVTGRERAINMAQGQGVRPSVAGALATWTEDPGDDQVAAANSPVLNLIAFEFAAAEVIVERPNGMLLFLLFNAAGVLQNSAPDFIVSDHRIPEPYTTRLQSCISCIRCHGPNRGHMNIRNDIKTLTAGHIDILDDVSSAQDLFDLSDTLVGLYEWDPTDPTTRAALVRSRDDFDDACYRATAGIKLPDGRMHKFKEPWGADEACLHLSQLYGYYTYTWILPLVAVRELGYDVKDEKAARDLIRYVLPSITPRLNITILDPHIAWLRLVVGDPANPESPQFITRPAWELIYFDAMTRSLLTSGKMAQVELAKQALRTKINRVKPRPVQTLDQKEILKKVLKRKAVEKKGIMAP